MTKSYVSIEKHVCIVCGAEFDTGAVLLDKRLRETFDKHTVTGPGLCPEHAALYEQGYIALVGVDPTKSTVTDGNIKPEDAYRTGEVIHVQQEVFDQLFAVRSTRADGTRRPMLFVDPAVVAYLEKTQHQQQEH